MLTPDDARAREHLLSAYRSGDLAAGEALADLYEDAFLPAHAAHWRGGFDPAAPTGLNCLWPLDFLEEAGEWYGWLPPL